ncbi:MAG: rhomboid family intramembrane serine protease [Candidatus Bipolaricaulia bacterium]
MLPLGDEIRPRLTPYVNWMMIASCIVVFLWQVSSGYEHFAYTLGMFGIVPARVLSGDGLYTFVTNIFLHGGWMHLLGNMLFLYIFGDNIEGACGHLRYLAFYITCGVAASALWVVTALGAHIPAVGASGAILGLFGALLGIGLGWGLGELINSAGLSYVPPSSTMAVPLKVRLVLGNMIAPFFTALFSALVSTLYPALRAARTGVVEALRYV